LRQKETVTYKIRRAVTQSDYKIRKMFFQKRKFEKRFLKEMND